MTWINRTTLDLVRASPRRMEQRHPADAPFVDGAGNAQSNAAWLWDPDLSPVADVESRYWKLTGDILSEMTQPEKDAVDAASLIAARDGVAAQLDQQEDILRSFMLVVVDEINILRGNDSLPDRTAGQMRNAIRSRLGT